MEIYTGREGEIILKKYSPIEELAECAAGFTNRFNGDRMSRLCFGSGTDCGSDRDEWKRDQEQDHTGW